MVFGKGIAKGLLTVIKHVGRTPGHRRVPRTGARHPAARPHQPRLVRRALHRLLDLRPGLPRWLHPGRNRAPRRRLVPRQPLRNRLPPLHVLRTLRRSLPLRSHPGRRQLHQRRHQPQRPLPRQRKPHRPRQRVPRKARLGLPQRPTSPSPSQSTPPNNASTTSDPGGQPQGIAPTGTVDVHARGLATAPPLRVGAALVAAHSAYVAATRNAQAVRSKCSPRGGAVAQRLRGRLPIPPARSATSPPSPAERAERCRRGFQDPRCGPRPLPRERKPPRNARAIRSKCSPRGGAVAQRLRGRLPTPPARSATSLPSPAERAESCAEDSKIPGAALAP